MQKDKLKLIDLRVNSFVTELNAEKIDTVKGGGSETKTKTSECETQQDTCTVVTFSFDDNNCPADKKTVQYTNCYSGPTVSQTVG